MTYVSDKKRFATNAVRASALELITRYRGPLRNTALRYSLSRDDADDAFQRASEILINRAPSSDISQLLPWMQTVVKHEAIAVRRQNKRAARTIAVNHVDTALSERPAPHDQTLRRERVRRSVEVLRSLKEQELKCLLLRATGYSYKEITDITGYSWTKVNRSVSEGRKHFLSRYQASESGLKI